MSGSLHLRITGRRWTETRALLLAVEPLCRMCKAKGLVTLAEEIDHVVPLHKYQGDDPHAPENLQPLCKPCHQDKTVQDVGYKTRTRIRIDGWPE